MMQIVNAQMGGDIIGETDDFVIFPVTLIAEMVLEYPEYGEGWDRQAVTFEELENSASTFSHKEITINHPKEGTLVDPDDIVGNLGDVTADPERRCLRTEGRVDKRRITPLMLEKLKGGHVSEVSTGYWCEIQQEPGTLGDTQYNAVQKKIMGNHLALLPDARGRCSYGDGCGIRENKENGEIDVEDTQEQQENKEPGIDTSAYEAQIRELQEKLNEKDGLLKKIANEEHEKLDREILALNGGLKPILENMTVCDKRTLLENLEADVPEKEVANEEEKTPSKFMASNGDEESFGIGEPIRNRDGTTTWVRPGRVM